MAKNQTLTSDPFYIRGVRISYPHLWVKESYKGKSTGKFACTLMLHKEQEAELIEQLQERIDDLVVEAFGKKVKVPAANLCLRDGDEPNKHGDVNEDHVDHFTMKLAQKNRPTVAIRQQDGKDIQIIKVEEPDEDEIYPGCRVDVYVSLWATDGDYGKFVGANCLAVCFVADDEPLGTGGRKVSDDEIAGFADTGGGATRKKVSGSDILS